jgi:hypothetical protein
MQTAVLYCANVGAAGVEPAERIVVVPEVTALIVQVPAPMLSTVKAVPIGNATEAFVGILKATAVPLFINSKT